MDARCYLEPILEPKMDSKSVPKSSKIGPETTLKGDSVSKLKKEGARSDAAVAGEYILKGSGPSEGGKQGGSRLSPHA